MRLYAAAGRADGAFWAGRRLILDISYGEMQKKKNQANSGTGWTYIAPYSMPDLTKMQYHRYYVLAVTSINQSISSIPAVHARKTDGWNLLNLSGPGIRGI